MNVRLLLKILAGIVGVVVLVVLGAIGMVLFSSTPVYTGADVAVKGVRKRMVKVNGIKLHIAEAGKSTQPLIVFLHGFPEFWYEWRAYLPYFASKGYYAVAPDQRGYNLSEKPKNIADYHTKHLVGDLASLIKVLGKKKAYVVGHDWGAFVAWGMAIYHPEMLHKVVTINVPHPYVFLDAMKNNPKQRRRSWYMGFFRIPAFPEKLLGQNNWLRASKALTDSSIPGTYSKAELQHYRHAWSRPRAMTSMLNWYRAMNLGALSAEEKKKLAAKIAVPTTLIWGAKDTALGVELAKPSVAMCKNGKLDLIEDATHWVIHEKVKHVQNTIETFFGGKKSK